MDNITYESVLEDVIALVKRDSRGKNPKVTLSRETAALLDAVTTTGPPTVHETPVEPVRAAENKPETVAPPREIPQSREITPDPGDSETLDKLQERIAVCEKCPLAETRLNTVPGEGDPRAALVFVGEAPGASEDKQGRPFVGRAGNLLTDIITKGMQLRREDVFICNVLKCRPPDNRTPNPEEVGQCEPYLLRQLEIIRPRLICALGGTAAQTLLKTDTPLGRLRGVWHNYHGIPLRVTYHPAYLLRKPAEKAKTWEDVKAMLRCLNGEETPDI